MSEVSALSPAIQQALEKLTSACKSLAYATIEWEKARSEENRKKCAYKNAKQQYEEVLRRFAELNEQLIKAYLREVIDLGDEWELRSGYETENCFELLLIRVPTGDWPLPNDKKQEFVHKLASVMHEVENRILKRCQEAE